MLLVHVVKEIKPVVVLLYGVNEFLVVPEEVGHAPNCNMVEVINQSGACIFSEVDFGRVAVRRNERFSLRVFSA